MVRCVTAGKKKNDFINPEKKPKSKQTHNEPYSPTDAHKRAAEILTKGWG